MANDPHLEVNRLPNVWAEHVIELPDDTVFAATLPGLPGAVVGRSRRLAWGATYTFMDAVDSWVEECRGGAARRGDGWAPFTARRETIRQKRGDPVEVVFYENRHGVLDGDPHAPGYYLATRWAPADSGAASLNAAAAMWAARTVDDGAAILGRIESAWNWVLADGDGRIAYQMSGRMPLRHPDASGFAPMPGWDPAFDWRGWASPADLPRVVDPPEGFIVTANQDLNALGRLDPINMPMGDYRARRIAALLAEGPCDLDTFRRIHQDVFSIQADEMLAILTPELPDTDAARLLRGWDRCYDVDSRGAALFEAFYRELLAEVFAPGGLGAPALAHLLDATGVFIDFYQQFDRVLTTPGGPWLAGRSLGAVYRAAFDRAAAVDRGVWGAHNRVTLTNILFQGRLPRWLGFDRGPIPLPGGRATPHQGQVYTSGGRATSFAPSLRILVDLGEQALHSALAGGPSDARRSRWYCSDLERWRRGAYKRLERADD